MITGMDVSAWQGNVNWGKAAKNGVRFAFIKVSQRLYADKLFFQNCDALFELKLVALELRQLSIGLLIKGPEADFRHIFHQLLAHQLAKSVS